MTDKEKYANLRKNGICVYCKNKPAADGKCACDECREKMRKQTAESGKTRCALCNAKERQRARRDRGMTISRSERPSYGLCYFCGKEISAGRICKECSTRVQGNLPEDPPKNMEWERQNRLIGKKAIFF